MGLDETFDKDKNAFMNEALKYSDVIERVGLHDRTAKYVLAQEGLLTGMPEAAGQGKHREFTVQQAMRLSICTTLVMVGIPLRAAARVASFCEQQVRSQTPKLFRRPVTYGRESFSEPWELEVIGARYVRVWCGECDGDYGARWAYYDIAEDKVHTFRQRSPEAPLRVELGLTELERKLLAPAT
jgi:hypothetical protein